MIFERENVLNGSVVALVSEAGFQNFMKNKILKISPEIFHAISEIYKRYRKIPVPSHVS